MRRSVALVVALVAASLALCVSAEDEKYSDKYDDIDVDEVLANPRLRTQYLKCFLGTGPCSSPVALFLKGMRKLRSVFGMGYVLGMS